MNIIYKFLLYTSYMMHLKHIWNTIILIYTLQSSLHPLFDINKACTDTFYRTNDTASTYGMFMSGPSTVEACTAYCLSMANCGHFDFYRATSSCYYHSMGSIVSHEIVAVDQFTRVKCTISMDIVISAR